MSTTNNPNEVIFTRVFNAPRQLVWDVWTQAEHLLQWMGPAGAKGTYAKMDFRSGGSYHYAIEFGGNEIWGRWSINEIDPPEKLTVLQSFSDKDGGIVAHPMSPNWPKKMLSITTFEENGGEGTGRAVDSRAVAGKAGVKTTVSVHWEPFEATELEIDTFEAARPGMGEGWAGTFVRLDEYLENMRK